MRLVHVHKFRVFPRRVFVCTRTYYTHTRPGTPRPYASHTRMQHGPIPHIRAYAYVLHTYATRHTTALCLTYAYATRPYTSHTRTYYTHTRPGTPRPYASHTRRRVFVCTRINRHTIPYWPYGCQAASC